MSNTVLVTGKQFITPAHIQQLQAVGLSVERLDENQPSEQTLVNAMPGKVGYIVGADEQVTPAMIAAASDLKAVVYPGTDWANYISGYDQATEKGILIANAPGANAYSVAEYTLMLMLMLLRRPLELGSTGTSKLMTTGSIVDARVGLIGLGRIGELVARMLVGIGASDVVYWSRQAKPELHDELGIRFMPLEELVATADVISTHTPSSAGEILTKDLLRSTKKGVVLVNTGTEETYNLDGLYDLLVDQKARAAFDFPIDETRFNKLTADAWFYSNAPTAYLTYEANQTAGDMATQSLINLLTTGQDDYRVN